MSERTPQPQAGFTLIETMIAMVILVVGLLAIANLNLVAASSNAVAVQATASADAASERLELLKSLPFDDAGLNAGGVLDVYDAEDGYADVIGLQGVGQIRIAWQIVDVDTNLKSITVRAEGTGVLSRSRSRAEFTTLRACTLSGCPGVP